jgi:hypothetical protein
MKIAIITNIYIAQIIKNTTQIIKFYHLVEKINVTYIKDGINNRVLKNKRFKNNVKLKF